MSTSITSGVPQAEWTKINSVSGASAGTATLSSLTPYDAYRVILKCDGIGNQHIVRINNLATAVYSQVQVLDASVSTISAQTSFFFGSGGSSKVICEMIIAGKSPATAGGIVGVMISATGNGAGGIAKACYGDVSLGNAVQVNRVDVQVGNNYVVEIYGKNFS